MGLIGYTAEDEFVVTYGASIAGYSSSLYLQRVFLVIQHTDGLFDIIGLSDNLDCRPRTVFLISSDVVALGT